jgi:hypothetical protein
MESFQLPWRPHRLWQPTDASFVSTRTFYAGIRPRGVLSGLFVITTPSEPARFYLMGSVTSIPLRLDDSFYEDGVSVFLAYEYKDILHIEDVLIWKGKELWSCQPFQTRWNYLNDFLKEWMPDTIMQGKSITIASYTSLSSMIPPTEGMILELIPNQARQKRLILLVEAEKQPTEVEWVAIRETARGPDVYSVMKKGSTESDGIACVQSLAVSRALRVKTSDTFSVRCQWHERFKKWEIMEVL